MTGFRSCIYYAFFLWFIQINPGKLCSQTVCNEQGNLFIISNYDGGIVTINVDVDIPNLKIGICTYEPVRVTISGVYAGNVTRVVYAGFNSNQNNNNCGLGNFSTSISGVPSGIRSILTYPPVGYQNNNGNSNMVCGVGNCNPSASTGGCNTADQIVYYFQQVTGGLLYAHYTQYNCWLNQTIRLSDAGNCCVVPLTAPLAGFSASITAVCAGDCVQFSNLSSGSPFSTVSWTFEGGNPTVSSATDPEVCYEVPGLYQVSLSVGNAAGADTETKAGYILVGDRPETPAIQHVD